MQHWHKATSRIVFSYLRFSLFYRRRCTEIPNNNTTHTGERWGGGKAESSGVTLSYIWLGTFQTRSCSRPPFWLKTFVGLSLRFSRSMYIWGKEFYETLFHHQWHKRDTLIVLCDFMFFINSSLHLLPLERYTYYRAATMMQRKM